MKARNYYFLGLILIVGFLTMDYFLNQKMTKLKKQFSDSKNLASVNSNLNLPSSQQQINPQSADSDSVAANIQFQSDFKKEVSQIGQTQNDPEIIENRLQSLARQMENDDRQYLKSVLLDQNSNGDDRAMAIELLTRNQTAESAEILKNYTTIENGDLGVRAEQELVFKAQAIEGLAAYQDRNVALSYLNEISQKTNYKFLQDRVRRAEASLKNEAPSIESQDVEALKKIIQ